MALSIAALKSLIDQKIYSNGNREITGDLMNDILEEVIDTFDSLDVKFYSQDTQPIATRVGSLWYKPSTNELYRFNGISWDLLDLSGSVILEAIDILYDNSNGLLTSTNVQDALDEISVLSVGGSGSTGLLYGGEISVNGLDNTKLDIAAGKGIIVDSHSANLPVATGIEWDAITISIPNLATQFITYIAIDSAGLPQAFNSALTQNQLRDYIVLGAAIHPSLTFIDKAAPNPLYINDPRGTTNDFIHSIGGLINLEGNIYCSIPGGKTLCKTAGKQFGDSINYGTSRKEPNIVTSPENNPATFFLATATGLVGGGISVPTDQYDKDGLGVLTPITDGWYGTLRVYYSALTDITVVAYGQQIYDSLKKASNNIDLEMVKKLPVLEDLVLRTIIIFEKDITTFDNIKEVRFVNYGLYGDKDKSESEYNHRFAESVEIVDGMSYKQQDINYVVDGGNLYAEVELEGTGDMTYVFHQSEHILDCTTSGKARVQLTPGSDISPTRNYIYVTPIEPNSAILNASTTPPSGEFAWVGTVLVPSIAKFSTDGVYSSQRYIDAKEFNGRGALSYERERIRVLGASWYDGVLPNFILDTVPTPDSLNLTVSQGEVYQMHKAIFKSFDISTDGIYVLNDPTTPWTKLTNLNQLTVDANGDSLLGSCFNIVVGGIISSANGIDYSKLFLLLPSGLYASNAKESAARDENNTAVTSVPKELKNTAFLIARVTIRIGNAGNIFENVTNTVSGVNFYDLRGVSLGANSGGAGIPSVTTFTDDVFRVLDNIDTTKQLAFELSNISTATTRTLSIPDENGEILLDGRSTNTTFNGDVIVNGNIYQQGTGTIIISEEVRTENDLIELRYGAVTALAPTEYTGFISKLYDGVNDGGLLIGADGIARVGDIGDLQAVATRDDNPDNLAIAVWDASTLKFATVPTFVYKNDNLGIGTATPTEKLDVRGDVIFGDGSTVPRLYLLDSANSVQEILNYDTVGLNLFTESGKGFTMQNDVGDIYLNITGTGKVETEKTVTVSTPASIVTLNFDNWFEYTLTLNQNTTLNITGIYKTNDVISIRVVGDYLVYVNQIGKTFKGKLDTNNVLLSYNGLKTNYIRFKCVDAATHTFVVISSELN